MEAHTVSVLTTNVSLANSDEYENYLKREGTKHELTIPKCPCRAK